MNHSLFFAKALVWLLLAGGFLPLAQASTVPNTSGHIVTRAGVTINFTGVNPHSKVLGFVWGPEQTQTSLPLANITRIRFGEGSQTARIELRDGRMIEATRTGRSRSGHIEWGFASFGYHILDRITGETPLRYALWPDIAEIVFDEAVGRFRVCSKCKAVWPDTYLFCPRDGTPTEWGPTPDP